MRFQINPTPIQTPAKKPLPDPPFIFRHSTFDEWLWFLDDYPELEDRYRWRMGQNLRDFHPELEDEYEENEDCYGIAFKESRIVFYISTEEAFEEYAEYMEVV